MKNLSAIILLFIANSVSGVAQGISMIAIPWYFAQQEETRKFAIIYILVNFISLAWGPLSGTFVDKYNRKNIFLAITVVSGLLLAGVSWYGYLLGGLPWYMVAFVFAFTFFNYNIHYPTLYAFVQEITEQRFYGKVASYIEIQGQLTSMLAGAGAAMLLEGAPTGQMELVGLPIHLPFPIEKWAIHEIFFIDACTYAVAFVFILLIRFIPIKIRHPETGTIRQRLVIGINYLKENKSIFLFGVASYSIFVTVLISTFFLFAIYVSNHLQAGGDVFASCEMMYALGAVFAGVGIRRLFRGVNSVKAIFLLTLITAGLFFTLAISKSLFVFYLLSLVLGISNAGTRILRVNYLFHHVPNQVYGRAGSIFFLTNVSFRILFLGLFYLSFFHEKNNVIYTFAILGVFLLANAFVLLRFSMKSNDLPAQLIE